jgi:hypothetical protein
MGGWSRSCPEGRVRTSESGEVTGKVGRSVKKCVHMYVNANMIPVETIPGIQGVGEDEGKW